MPQAAMMPGVRIFHATAPRIQNKSLIARRYRRAAAPFGRRRGVGVLDPQSLQIGRIAQQGVALAASTLVAMGTIAGPVGMAIAGIAAIGLQIANAFSGCGDTCVEATHIADQVGAYIDQMFNTYMASPIHYRSMQLAYLQTFDAAWAAMVKACNDPALGAAGQRCISDREAGSCAYHTSPGGWQQQNGQWVYVAPGPNNSGTACWNSFIGRRDPVANDPTVVPDPPSSVVSSLFGGGGASSVSSFGISSNLLLPAALLAGGVALFAMGD